MVLTPKYVMLEISKDGNTENYHSKLYGNPDTTKYCDTQNLKHDSLMRLNTKLSEIMEIFLKDGTTVNYNL